MRRLALALALAVLALTTACGVPEDDSPQELSAEQVPADLLETPTSTTAPIQVIPIERQAELFFVNGEGEVQGVTREVEDQSPEKIIQALLATDTQSLDPGLTSNIPPETRLLDIFSAEDDDDVLVVDLSEEFTTIVGGSFIAAVAQIVFTAEAAGFDAVAFQVDGDPIEVQDEAGEQQDDPVTPLDYQSLRA
jgi:spore germination protein GerM